MVCTRNEILLTSLKDSRWTFEEEIALLSLLLDAREEHELSDEEVVRRLCVRIARVLSRDFENYFSPAKVINKLHSLRERYNEFVEYTKLIGVQYDASRNLKIVDGQYWEIIGRETYKQRRFRTFGEPHYRDLTFLLDNLELAPIPPIPEPGQDESDPIVVDDSDEEPEVIDPTH